MSDYRIHAVAILLVSCAAAAIVPAHAQETSPSGAIVVSGAGLEDSPATPAYDVETIARDRILLVNLSGRGDKDMATVAERSRMHE